jgi:hypothetical protein
MTVEDEFNKIFDEWKRRGFPSDKAAEAYNLKEFTIRYFMDCCYGKKEFSESYYDEIEELFKSKGLTMDEFVHPDKKTLSNLSTAQNPPISILLPP